MVDTKDRVEFPTDEQMANLRAAAGKFRLIAVDTFEGPFAHAVVGDFNDKAEAFSEAHRIETTESNGGLVKCYVYDDKGQQLTPPLAEQHDHNSTSYSPFLTRRFDLALQVASGLHFEQPRKGTEIPYIAHLMSVCALVLENGGDEDQAVAALLHDSAEDQGGLATLSTIRRLFGDRVANAVESCSDSTESDPAKKADWRGRKEKYLEHLLKCQWRCTAGCSR